MSTVEQLEQRLTRARARLTAADAVATNASKRAEGITPGASNRDPGALSGIRRKRSARADNRRISAYTRNSEAHTRLTRLRDEVRHLEILLSAAIKERDRVPFTRDDLAGAEYVRTQHGWHKVVRINQTSVSVATGYSWVDRYPFDRILQATSIKPSGVSS